MEDDVRSYLSEPRRSAATEHVRADHSEVTGPYPKFLASVATHQDSLHLLNVA